MRVYFILVFIGFSVIGKTQNSSSFTYSDVEFMTKWYHVIFPLTEAEAATVAARNLAYIDIAFYETVAISSPSHFSMSRQLTNFTLHEDISKKRIESEYYAPIAANRAMMRVSLNMFHYVQSRLLRNVLIHADSMDLFFKQHTNKKIYENSFEIGDKIANEIISWAKEDGGYDACIQPYDIYFKNKTGCDSCWVFHERSLKSGGPMTPNWGRNRLFVKENEMIDIRPVIAFSTNKNSIFYQQALEVYKKSKVSSNTFNKYNENEKLADFWNDAANLDDAYTPATHSHSMLVQCFEQNLKLKLPEIAEIFCKLGIGLSDAFVIAWKEKQEHFLIRPDTYIQNYIDKSWQPFIVSPPFPEFPSGHSTQIGAFETIMSSFLGEKFSFTDNRLYRGIKKFPSFSKAADEVVEARILAGIHYRFSSEQGRELGNSVAKNILKINFKNINK